MDSILQAVYLGNTLQQWLIAIGIIVGGVVAGKLVYWLFATVGRRLASRTASKLDDLFIDMVEEPLVAAVIFAGVWLAIRFLTLPEGVDRFVGNVVEVLIALTVGWLVSRLLDAVYKEYITPLAAKTETDLDDQLLPLLRKATKAVVWSLTVIIALNNAGYDVAALLAGIGIGGLALAMAAKDTVSNVFGGFTIFTDKPFRVNDRIQISGFDGTVKEIGVRSTRLQTLAGRIVTIPNATFAESPVENISSEPSRKVVANLGLTYDTTPKQMEEAIDTLQKIVDSEDDLEEQTYVAFTEFGDFALNILFIYYIRKGADIMNTMSAVNLRVLREFNGRGLDFAFPTQTLYTKTLAD